MNNKDGAAAPSSDASKIKENHSLNFCNIIRLADLFGYTVTLNFDHF